MRLSGRQRIVIFITFVLSLRWDVLTRQKMSKERESSGWIGFPQGEPSYRERFSPNILFVNISKFFKLMGPLGPTKLFQADLWWTCESEPPMPYSLGLGRFRFLGIENRLSFTLFVIVIAKTNRLFTIKNRFWIGFQSIPIPTFLGDRPSATTYPFHPFGIVVDQLPNEEQQFNYIFFRSVVIYGCAPLLFRLANRCISGIGFCFCRRRIAEGRW